MVTHVAGIIADSGDTSNGRFKGVASGANLYIAKVFSGSTGGAKLTAILDAVEWAVIEKIDVINMSQPCRVVMVHALFIGWLTGLLRMV